MQKGKCAGNVPVHDEDLDLGNYLSQLTSGLSKVKTGERNDYYIKHPKAKPPSSFDDEMNQDYQEEEVLGEEDIDEVQQYQEEMQEREQNII